MIPRITLRTALPEGGRSWSWRTLTCGGPGFLHEPPDRWPAKRLVEAREDISETRKAVFCRLVADHQNPDMLDTSQYASWSALVNVTYRSLHGAAAQDTNKQTLDCKRAEALILSQCCLHPSSTQSLVLFVWEVGYGNWIASAKLRYIQ